MFLLALPKSGTVQMKCFIHLLLQKTTHAISLPSLCFIFMWAQRWKEFLIWSKFIDQFNSTVLDFGRASKNSFLTTAHCIHFLAGKCMNLSVSNHNMWSRVSFFIEQQDSAFFDQLWNVVSLAHTCDCYDLHRVSQLNNIWKLVEKRTILLFLKKRSELWKVRRLLSRLK